MVEGGNGRPRSFRRIPQGPFSVLARIIGSEILAKADIIARNPRIGRPIEGGDEYRQLVLRVLNAPYVFQYRFDGKRLIMLRIWHGRENRTPL
jgi:plasmid stabilization system protein ParE